MTKARLNLACWLAIIHAALTIPIIIISIFLDKLGAIGKVSDALLTLLDLAIFLSNPRLRTPGVSPGVKASEGWEGFVGLCC